MSSNEGDEQGPHEPGPHEPGRIALGVVAREWGRIGITGVGGPPAHIALFRTLCVTRRGWLSEAEFEDAIAATGLLPGPASTQLAIYCAWRVRGTLGAVVGGLCFIVPGLVVIVALSALYLGRHPPRLVEAAAAGAGAAVPAVALAAAASLAPGSWRRSAVPGHEAGGRTGADSVRSGTGCIAAGHLRWMAYVAAGAVAAALTGPWLVAVLAICGLVEVVVWRSGGAGMRAGMVLLVTKGSGLAAAASAATAGGLAALVWVAFKVGALSYGGGFVIVPLMQHDAVTTYHWMSSTQFLGAVALGQVTPGPVVLTVAVVGYAAAGVGGSLLATVVAFGPSFGFILVGAKRFSLLKASPGVQAFLRGAGPAAVGGIAGAALPLALALAHLWQAGVVVVAAGWLLGWRRSVPTALLGAAAIGVVAVLAGAPIPH